MQPTSVAFRGSRAGVRLRWIVSLVSGLGVGFASASTLGVPAALLAGWAARALVNSGWVLLEVWGMRADSTRAHATVEDPGRRVARLVTTAGSVSSLGAVFVVAVQAHRTHGVESYALADIAVLSVVTSPFSSRHSLMRRLEPAGQHT